MGMVAILVMWPTWVIQILSPDHEAYTSDFDMFSSLGADGMEV